MLATFTYYLQLQSTHKASPHGQRGGRGLCLAAAVKQANGQPQCKLLEGIFTTGCSGYTDAEVDEAMKIVGEMVGAINVQDESFVVRPKERRSKAKTLLGGRKTQAGMKRRHRTTTTPSPKQERKWLLTIHSWGLVG